MKTSRQNNDKNLLKLNQPMVKTIKVDTIILNSSSDTSPSVPSLSTSTYSQITTTTQTRNVTPVTPSKNTRSQITDTSSISSSSITSRSPITEIPFTPRSQPSPINTPLVHIYTLNLLNATKTTNNIPLIKLLDSNLNSILYIFLILNIHNYLHYNYHQKPAQILENYILHQKPLENLPHHYETF